MFVTVLLSMIILLVHRCMCLRFPISMPYVRPQLPNHESYLCTGVAVQQDTELYITGFTPLASKHTVHHLMVIGCEAPVSGVEMNLWNCGGSLHETQLPSPGSTCPGSAASQVLYMWSLDADSLMFPDNVSLSVGGNSSIQHLVLQVHYISNLHIPSTGDQSGVVVEYQDTPTPYSAGIVSLHVHGVVPAGDTAQWDSACRLLGIAAVQPWAYLGHTHHHGRLVTGWRVAEDMTWSSLGRADPRHPQRFNSVTSHDLLYPGDILASRCVMQPDPDQHNEVKQGLSSNMEMCDFFLYFFTRREDIINSPVGQQCTNKGPPEVSWLTMGLKNIPEESFL